MAEGITIDIQLLQGVFAQLQAVQQTLAGITGGVSVMDQRTAAATSSINKSFQAVNQVVGQVESTVDRSMGNVVQDLLGPIARTQELETKLRDLNARMSTTRSVREMSNLKREAAAVQQELNRIDARGVEQRVGGPLSRVRGLLGGLPGQIAAGFAVGGVVGLGRSIVDATAKTQMFDASMRTLLGSQELAARTGKELREFASSTPFELVELREYTTRLLAYQVAQEDLVPTMERLGNIAAGVGKDKLPNLVTAFGQVKNAGKLTGGELKQFTEAGVPLLSELAKVTGMTVEQMSGNVGNLDIPFSQVEQAIKNMTSEGGMFFNLMDAQSKTIGGMLSNVADDWTNFLEEVGAALAPQITAGIGMFKSLIGGLGDAFRWVQEHGTLVKGVLIGVATAMGIYTAALVTNAAATFVATLRSGGLVAAMGLQTIVTNAVSAATVLWEVAQWAINVALTANPIGIVIVAIGALVAAIAWAWENVEWFRGALTGYFEAYKAVFIGVWETAKSVFDAIVQIVMSSWKVIKGVMSFDGDMIAEGWAEHQAGASKLIDTLTGAPKKIIGGVVDAAVKGYEDGTEDFRAEKAAEEKENGLKASAQMVPAGTMDAKSANGNIGAASLLGGAAAGTGAGGGVQGNGVTVGGSGGGDRNISMNVTINVPLKVERDVEMSASRIADQVIGMLVNKLRDAEFALG